MKDRRPAGQELAKVAKVTFLDQNRPCFQAGIPARARLFTSLLIIVVFSSLFVTFIQEIGTLTRFYDTFAGKGGIPGLNNGHFAQKRAESSLSVRIVTFARIEQNRHFCHFPEIRPE